MCSTKRFVAVEDDFGAIAECDCGTLHVTVGPVSVALSREALQRLHALTAAALRRLTSKTEDAAECNRAPVLGRRPH